MLVTEEVQLLSTRVSFSILSGFEITLPNDTHKDPTSKRA